MRINMYCNCTHMIFVLIYEICDIWPYSMHIICESYACACMYIHNYTGCYNKLNYMVIICRYNQSYLQKIYTPVHIILFIYFMVQLSYTKSVSFIIFLIDFCIRCESFIYDDKIKKL